VENLFAEPCERPAAEPAALDAVYARALPDGGVQIEATTSRPVRAMHYLHEKGNTRHWVLWLENVTSEAADVPVVDGVDGRVRVVPRDGVTAIITDLAPDQRVKVQAEQLDSGWRLTLKGAEAPES
jgi:hypothetical protein